MKKIKQPMFIIILISIIFIASGIIIQCNNLNDSNEDNGKIIQFDKSRTLNICKTKDNCNIVANYETINYSGSIKEIKNVVNKINNKIIKSYENDKQYENTDNCSKLNKNLYYTQYKIYINQRSEYASVTLIPSKNYICTGETQRLPASDTYFYSRKDNKFLKTDEIKTSLGITDSQIEYSIKQNILNLNEITKSNFSYENTFQNGQQNIKIFYTGAGKTLIQYVSNEDNQSHFAELKEVGE